jgi:hypothetical protein
MHILFFLSKIFFVPLHFIKKTVNVLELSDIRKSFGDVRVLNGINLRLEKGLVYTLKRQLMDDMVTSNSVIGKKLRIF